MKKIILIFLMLSMLCGCSKTSDNGLDSEETLNVYYNSFNEVDTKSLPSTSDYFSIEVTASKSLDKYHYVITVSEPKVAMMNIKMMAIISSYEKEKFDIDDAVSYGIGNDEISSMVPNQINKANNCVDNVSLDFKLDASEAIFTVLVEWKNKDGNQTFREYCTLHSKYEENQQNGAE